MNRDRHACTLRELGLPEFGWRREKLEEVEAGKFEGVVVYETVRTWVPRLVNYEVPDKALLDPWFLNFLRHDPRIRAQMIDITGSAP